MEIVDTTSMTMEDYKKRLQNNNYPRLVPPEIPAAGF